MAAPDVLLVPIEGAGLDALGDLWTVAPAANADSAFEAEPASPIVDKDTLEHLPLCACGACTGNSDPLTSGFASTDIDGAPVVGQAEYLFNTPQAATNAVLTQDTRYQWHGSTTGQALVVNYSFATQFPLGYDSTYSASSWSAFTNKEQVAVRQILSLYAEVANVTFNEVAYNHTDPTPMLFGGNVNMGNAAAVTWMYSNGSRLIYADIFVDDSYTDPDAGDYDYLALIHEIGHGLGLKHPGNYNAGGGGADAPYLTSYGLPDTRQYTVMSYNEHGAYGSLEPLTPMLLDIAAIQFLYGARTSFHAGNDTYTFATSTQIKTVWDGGGIDTFDLSNQSGNNQVNLDPGSFSSIAAGAGNNNIAIAYGANIEHAIGGSGNDAITGNALSNSLRGGEGRDSLYGGDGADTLAGEGGDDTMYGGAGDDLYRIDSAGDFAGDTINGNDTVEASISISLATMSGIENITLTGNVALTATGNGVANALLGNDSANLLDGAGAADTLSGGAGDDTLDGGAGNDSLAGGAGSGDVARFAAARAAYEVIRTASGNGTVRDLATGEIDTLTGIETLRFSDGDVLFDTVDQLQGLSVSDAQVTEGNAGTRQLVFTITLSAPSALAVSVNYNTVAGTASAGSDFLAVSGTLTFNPGATETFVVVTVPGDTSYETDETLSLVLSNPVNAVIADNTGIGTILNDDAAAGYVGTAGADTMIGTAGADTFFGLGGNDSIIANNGSDTIYGGDGNDRLWGDNQAYGPDMGDLIYGDAGNDTIQGGDGNNTIYGGSGLDFIHIAGYGADLSYGGDDADQIHNFAGNDTAFGGAGDDTISLGDGSNVGYGGDGDDEITGNADTVFGGNGADTFVTYGKGLFYGGAGNDTAYFHTHSSSQKTITAVGNEYRVTGGGDTTILRNVEVVRFTNSTVFLAPLVWLPTLSISGATVVEGDNGTSVLRLNVTLDGDGPGPVSVNYSTVAGTATAGSDFVAASGTVTMDPDFPGGTIDIAIVGDVVGEGAETFTVTLSNVANAVLGQASATVTISDTDPIPLGPGPDVLTGTTGNDTLDGLEGNDTVNGLAGNDSLVGGAGNDLLDGGADNDALFGGDGADTLLGGAGNDTLVSGAGNDSIDGGAGVDTYDISAATQGATITLLAGASAVGDGHGGTDTISGIENVTGGGFADVLAGDLNGNALVGNGGDDAIYGGAGADTIDGGAGNDYFEGGAGGDGMQGGDGADTAAYRGSAAAVNVNLLTGLGSGGDADGDTYSGIEYLRGSDFGDTLSGGDANNWIGGYVGNDSIVGNAGDDWLLGGAGHDSVEGGDGNDGVFGDEGDDAVYGGAGGDTVDGGAGADYLEGGAGADVLNGGGGFDVASYMAATAGIAVSLATGLGTAGEATGDTLTGIEYLRGSTGFGDTLGGDGFNNWIAGFGGNDSIVGLAGDDWLLGGIGHDTVEGGDGGDGVFGDDGDDALYGGAGGDSIDGGAGADYLEGGLGADNLIGGGGADVASYMSATSGVTVSLETGLGTAGEATGDTLTGIEYLRGSLHADVLVGSVLNNWIAGFDGADSISGLAGDDWLLGGGGNDTIDAGTGADGAFGDAGDDVLYGGDGADSLSGGDGNDVLSGGGGIDTLLGGAGTDEAFYLVGATTGVNANLLTGLGSGGDAEGDTYNSIEALLGTVFADTLVGDNGANTLTGWSGNDSLTGNGGDDYISGLDGNDTLSGGDGNDTLDDGIGVNVYSGGNGSDLLLLERSQSGIFVDLFNGLGADGVVRFTGIEDVRATQFSDTMQGSDGANRVWGNAGNDSFLAMGGDDEFYGDAGNDTFDGGAGNDYVEGGLGADALNGGNGYDTAAYRTSTLGVNVNLITGLGSGGDAAGDTYTAIEYLRGSDQGDTLAGDHGNNWMAGYAGDDSVSGGTGDDWLLGGAGNDTVDGGDGNDGVFGDAGDDMLVGGNGADTLTGGAGADTFLFNGIGPGVDTIADFTGGSGGDQFGFVLSGYTGLNSGVTGANALYGAGVHSTSFISGTTAQLTNTYHEAVNVLVVTDGIYANSTAAIFATRFNPPPDPGGGGQMGQQSSPPDGTIVIYRQGANQFVLSYDANDIDPGGETVLAHLNGVTDANVAQINADNFTFWL